MEDSETTVPGSGGEEHVYAAAYHILKALGTSKNLPHDMRSLLADLEIHLSAMTLTMEMKKEGFAEIEERLECAEKEIMAWEPNLSKVGDSGPEEVEKYLRAVDKVQSLIQNLRNSSLVESRKGREVLSQAQCVLQTAMSRLEEVLTHTLVHDKQFFKPEYMSFRSTRDDFVYEEPYIATEDDVIEEPSQRNNRAAGNTLDDNIIDLVKPDAIPVLKSIADVMFASNYDQEFCNSFIRTRKNTLDEYLVVLQVETISIEDILKLEWSDLNRKIKRWNWIMKVIIRVYFMSEKRLYDRILGHLGSVSSICFVETTRAAMLGLMGFGEAIAMGPYQPEKLFRLLDMYEALDIILPNVVALFSEEYGLPISNEFLALFTRLGDSARLTFIGFRNAVESNRSTNPFPGGGVHHLTKYVMNYIKTLSDYGDVLRSILRHENGEDSDPMAYHFQSVMAVLELNLVCKSKLYKDISLQHIFLMNNIHYMVEKSKNSKLRVFVGDVCIRSYKVKLQQHVMSYERCSWSPILYLLQVNGHLCPTSLSKPTIKQRYRSFSMAFEQIYESQTGWCVPDLELRRVLQVSISQKIILAYRSFIYHSTKNSLCMKDKYIKYSVDDLQNYILDLFEGSPRCLPQVRRR